MSRSPHLRALAVLLAIALAVHVGSAIAAARAAGVPLAELGVFFDGHIYLEIAKSFPMPYSAQGRDYLGHAPGYPAVAYASRALLPDRWVDWGMAMLVATWLPAALSALAFYALCTAAGLPPFWPSVLFVVGNPTWVATAGTPHAEPLAMLCVVLALRAHLRGKLGWSVALLALATLARYPAVLLGLPMALCVLANERRFELRTLALLCVPLIGLGLVQLYLLARIPDFPGVLEAHRVFWDTHFTWPFAALATNAERWLWSREIPQFEVTYASVAVYVFAALWGLRRSERDLRILPLSIAVLVLFHVSLSGLLGAWDFTRLVILAWPAAVIVLCRSLPSRTPVGAWAALCGVAAAFGLHYTVSQTVGIVSWQAESQPYLRDTVRRLDSDEPHWIDFRALRREQQRRLPDARSGARTRRNDAAASDAHALAAEPPCLAACGKDEPAPRPRG